MLTYSVNMEHMKNAMNCRYAMGTFGHIELLTFEPDNKQILSALFKAQSIKK